MIFFYPPLIYSSLSVFVWNRLLVALLRRTLLPPIYLRSFNSANSSVTPWVGVPLFTERNSFAMPDQRKIPVHEIRIGRIKATLWEQQVDNRTFISTVICRLYKDGKYWKQSSSFDLSDLPLVAKVADHAYAFIFNRMQEGKLLPVKSPIPEETTSDNEPYEPLEDFEYEARKQEYERECGRRCE